MTTSPSEQPVEPCLRLSWQAGDGRRSRLFRVADPTWRQAHSYLAAIPSAHVRIVYDHATAH